MTSRGTSYELVVIAANSYDAGGRSEVEGPGVGVGIVVEAEASVVRADHVRGRDDAVEAVLAQHRAASPDELAGGEVAVARGDVVELDPGHAVTVVADQHHADRLVAALHQE